MDGYTFTASRTGFAENYIAGRLDFQVTYKGVNLPWVGNLAERLGFPPYGFDKVWALPWAWYAQAPSGYWITSGNFALPTDSSGQLSDYHSTSCGPTGPSPSPTPLTTGKFRDASTSQEIGFVKPTTGATISLGTHGIEEYSYFTTAVDGVFQKH